MSPLFYHGIRRGREKNSVVDYENEEEGKREKFASFIGRIKDRSIRGVIGCSHRTHNVHIFDETELAPSLVPIPAISQRALRRTPSVGITPASRPD